MYSPVIRLHIQILLELFWSFCAGKYRPFCLCHYLLGKERMCVCMCTHVCECVYLNLCEAPGHEY